MPEVSAQTLLKSPTVTIRDVYCQGAAGTRVRKSARPSQNLCFRIAASMCAISGNDQAVAEANQVLFFNAAEGYRVSHPVPGGDASSLAGH